MNKRRSTAERALTAGVVALAVTAAWGYIASTRYASNEAISVIMGTQIPNEFEGASGVRLSPDMSLGGFTASYNRLMFMSSFYLDSDAARKIPEVSAPTSSAWLMLTFAKEVWEHEDAGDVRPLVADIYAAQAAIAINPELAELVIDSPEGPRIDNTDHRAVTAAIAAAQELGLQARTVGLMKHDVIPLDTE